MAFPKFINDMMLIDDAMRFAPRPSVSEVIARAGGVQSRQSPEDFLRRLARDVRLTEDLAAKSVDAGYSPDANIFGAPVKTIDQGRALGERNLPGMENLSPEDQIALASALDKGAMLRAMTGINAAPAVRRSSVDTVLPNFDVTPSNRIADITRSENPAVARFADIQPTMGEAMAALQNKAKYARMTGRDPSLPNPPVFGLPGRHGPTIRDLNGDILLSDATRALGSDVGDLARAIRKDQIDSRVMQARELADAQTNAAMLASADDVARMEARAMEYDNFPPETVAQMDKANRSHQSLMKGNTERLTGDPRYEMARRAQETSSPWDSAEGYSDWWDRTEGKDILKGLGLGHVLSYPASYAIYKAFGPGAQNAAAPEPARQLAELAQEEDEAFLEAEKARARADMFNMPEVPIDLPEMPLVTMPMDEVGLPDDIPEDMTFLEEGVDGAPAMDELDAELIAAGLQPAATSRQDIDSMSVNGQRVDSLYPPESVEYQMEQAYKRRTGKRPYPQLSY